MRSERAQFANVTPIRVSFRQTTRQGRRERFAGITRSNLSGMPTGLATSSAAPVADKFRTTQVIVLPRNSMLPDFRTRRRDAERFSFIAVAPRARNDDP